MITRSKKPVIIRTKESSILQNISGKTRLPAVMRLPNPTVRIRNRMVGYMFKHNERTAHLAKLIAKRMGLNASDQKISEYAGLLHNVGKGFVEAYIVHAPRKLTKKEYARIQKHTDYGRAFIEGELLKGNPLASLIAETAYYHHETIGKGRGYYGADAKRFGIHTKIIQVVEVADAILSKRSYKKRARVSYLIRELEKGKKNGQFDPEVVDAFLVALKKGELGIGKGLLDYEKVSAETQREMRRLHNEFKKQVLTTKSRAKILDKGGRSARLINQRRKTKKGEKHDPISNYY